MVSASPDTIWLARSVITRKAWISAMAAPASAATPIAAASAGPVATCSRCTAQKPHPLDAEVEHTGAFCEQLAERGIEERRPVRDARGEHDHEQRVVHATG